MDVSRLVPATLSVRVSEADVRDRVCCSGVVRALAHCCIGC